MGQQILKCQRFHALSRHQMHRKVRLAKLRHHLPAYAARGKRAGNNPIFSAAHGNSRKFPVSFRHRLSRWKMMKD